MIKYLVRVGMMTVNIKRGYKENIWLQKNSDLTVQGISLYNNKGPKRNELSALIQHFFKSNALCIDSHRLDCYPEQ